MSRIVGPAIAGLVIGYYGVGMCFLVNSISFAAVIISLFFIHPLTIQATVTSSKRILADIKDHHRHFCHEQQRAVCGENYKTFTQT